MTVSYRPEQDGNPGEPSARPVEPIRREITVRSPAAPPGGVRYFGSEHLNRQESARPLPLEQAPTAALATPTQRQPSALRNGAGNSATALASPDLDTSAASPPEVENGNVMLYRTHNFFLRTAYRPGQKTNPLRKPTGNTTAMPRVMPNQGRRIASSETRVMPKVTLAPEKQTRSIPLPTWLEAAIVVIGLLGTLVSHAYNMFNFPRYELDEGTYISNAWAITQGMISTTPYGYGHPPLGWIQIAAWLQLVGGPFAFGNALNTGRVFMLFFAVGSALLVYLIVRRMSGSISAGLLALAIFSLSPLAITYQRQIYLDNPASFWMLFSLYLLVASKSRLKYIVGAAICFGLSFLSKEIMLVFLPGMIYAAWLYSTKFQRKFIMTTFIYGVVAICSTFVLMAVLKGELFPYAWHLPWDTHPHLSMLDTLAGQVGRTQTGGTLSFSFTTWIDNDPAIIIAGIAGPLFNLLYGWWNRKQLMLGVLALLFWLLIVRGGQVLAYYVIPLLPLIAINTVMALNTIFGWVGKLIHFKAMRAVLLLLALAVVIPYDLYETGFRFYQHPTSAQQDAAVWIRDHVPHNSFIVINSYLYLDLRLPGGEGVGSGAPFPHAEVYWDVAEVPEIYQQTLYGNWDRIDYIVADSEMLNDINTYGGDMNIIKTAYQHSILLATFSAPDHALKIVVQIFQVIHLSGQPTALTGPSTPSPGTNALAQSPGTILTNGMPRGDPLLVNERRQMIGA